MYTNRLPIVLGFCFCPFSINGVAVVSAPEELALAVHLRGLIAQKYEAIIVHANLNVFSF